MGGWSSARRFCEKEAACARRYCSFPARRHLMITPGRKQIPVRAALMRIFPALVILSPPAVNTDKQMLGEAQRCGEQRPFPVFLHRTQICHQTRAHKCKHHERDENPGRNIEKLPKFPVSRHELTTESGGPGKQYPAQCYSGSSTLSPRCLGCVFRKFTSSHIRTRAATSRDFVFKLFWMATSCASNP